MARWSDATFVAVAAAGFVAAVALPFGVGPMIPAIAALIGFFTMWRPGPTLPETAARLDRRHHLHDLLASAWATRGDADPWSTALHAVADATAAALPPPGPVARFSPRHHACVLAGGVAVVLITRLVTPTHPDDRPVDTARTLAAVGQPGRPTDRRIAAETARAPDTAESPTRQATPAPVATDPPAGDSPRPRAPGDAANGPGRADSDRPTAPPPPASPTSLTDLAPTAPGPAGSGQPATSAGGPGAAGGRVTVRVTVPASAARDTLPAPVPPTLVPTDRPSATPVPAAYRDLVRDYFSR